MEDKLLKNPRITNYDSMYGYVGCSSIFAGRDLTEKDFKKWYKNYLKRIGKAIRYMDVLAEYEDDGMLCDLTVDWYNTEYEHNPAAVF